MPLQSKPVINVNLICFRDLTGHFGPLTDLRDFVDCRNAALTNFERIRKSMGKIPLLLQDLIHKESTNGVHNDLENRLKSFMPDFGHLFLNGRIIDWKGFISWFNSSFQSVLSGESKQASAFLDASGDLLCAWMPPHSEFKWANECQFIEQFKQIAAPASLDATLLATRPWHIQDHLLENLAFDLDLLAQDTEYLYFPQGSVKSASDWLMALDEADSQTFVMPALSVIDTREGSIAIHRSAGIQPFTSLSGPIHIGPDCKVISHTQLRKGACLGPVCKAAGEISKSVLQGYTNKSHPGYLGNSLVGEWVNLGADTTVSNLKNNYSSIKVQLKADKIEDSGRTFLGPVIGDYVRTAIGTRLTTGAIIGTGSMLAFSGLSPKYVPSFSWLTDHTMQNPGEARYDFDKFIETANAMMARRKCQLSEGKLALLKSLFEA